MPSLDEHYLRNLKATPPTTCSRCKGVSIKDYCRQCDVWIWWCQCPNDHEGHRTYKDVVMGADDERIVQAPGDQRQEGREDGAD